MKNELSWCSLTAVRSIVAQKLGQPVPESNLVSEENSGVPQHTQAYMPLVFSFQYGPVKARSVPCCRVTWYCAGVSCRCHSASVLTTFLTGDSPEDVIGAPLNYVMASFGICQPIHDHNYAASANCDISREYSARGRRWLRDRGNLTCKFENFPTIPKD